MGLKNNSLKEYEARVLLAINFINENISKKITLEEISSAACFSPFHFHRIFASITGETPVDFLNRVRLEKAANLLVNSPSMSITEISIVCGFSSMTVFSRAFKKHFGESASEWIKKSCTPDNSKKSKIESKNRKAEDVSENYFNSDDSLKNNFRSSKMNVDIKTLPPRHLAYFPQLDGYVDDKIKAAWERLCNWGAAEKLINKDTVFIGISFDNPCVTPPDKCRYYACITVPEDVKPPKGFGLYDLPGGRHAVARYTGKGDDLGKAWSEIYGLWLPSSGFEPANVPCFDIYHETPDQNKEGNFVMDLCIPVKGI